MAIALFLKVDGVTGESKNTSHADTTELLGVSWGASTPVSADSGGGLSAGEVAYQELTCSGTMDKAWPTLLDKMNTGFHIPKIEVFGTKMGGSQMDYFVITLTECMVSSMQVSAGSGSELNAAYSFSAAKMKIEYTLQTSTGGAGTSIPIEFDLKKNA
jgi:type VI secretion system secreted protein Hcp